MRLHATVSKDGRKLRARLHPSRRVAPAGATLLRMRSESSSRQKSQARAPAFSPRRELARDHDRGGVRIRAMRCLRLVGGCEQEIVHDTQDLFVRLDHVGGAEVIANLLGELPRAVVREARL